MTVFETRRTHVREWRRSDIPELVAVYGDSIVSRYIDDGAPLTPAEAEAWWHVTQNNYRKRGYGMWTVQTTADATPIGFVGLVHPGGQAVGEVKYAYRPAYWGQGFATEVLSALCTHVFANLDTSQIMATVAAGNHPSQRVLAKCGFTRAADRREDDGTITRVFNKHRPAV